MKKGFTLIEVLIVVIILGILATLAIPQFTKMTRRAWLAEAWAGLGGIRTAQAVYYMEYSNYADSITGDLDVTLDSTRWTYALSDVSASGYNATATGTGKALGVNAWLTPTASGASY